VGAEGSTIVTRRYRSSLIAGAVNRGKCEHQHANPSSVIAHRFGPEALKGGRHAMRYQRQLLSARMSFCLLAVVYHPIAEKGSDSRHRGNLSSVTVERVDDIFADMDMRWHPGAALLVIDRDEIVYRKYYGLADLETGGR
jgi:CubicO group peptidase (beta-lactamase class C family)